MFKVLLINSFEFIMKSVVMGKDSRRQVHVLFEPVRFLGIGGLRWCGRMEIEMQRMVGQMPSSRWPAMGFARLDCQFLCHADECAACPSLLDGAVKPPLVVMAHGFGGLKNCGLEPYAELFAEHGLAVLLFDYRGFGESEGTPRQLISPRRHVE